VNNADQSGADKPIRNRRIIDVSCKTHRAARGFVPLVCLKRDDLIELDVHAMGHCVTMLDETAATALFDLLGEWLG
jgi:hypothetical protein